MAGMMVTMAMMNRILIASIISIAISLLFDLPQLINTKKIFVSKFINQIQLELEFCFGASHLMLYVSLRKV